MLVIYIIIEKNYLDNVQKHTQKKKKIYIISIVLKTEVTNKFRLISKFLFKDMLILVFKKFEIFIRIIDNS